MKISEGKYVWSQNEIFNGEEFDTVEEALVDATQSIYEEGAKVPIGKIKAIDISINADLVLENLAEDACNQCGDVSDGFLEDVTDKQVSELEDELNKVLKDWLEDNLLMPSFYAVNDVKEYTITLKSEK